MPCRTARIPLHLPFLVVAVAVVAMVDEDLNEVEETKAMVDAVKEGVIVVVVISMDIVEVVVVAGVGLFDDVNCRCGISYSSSFNLA